jgi:hypothetical protein
MGRTERRGELAELGLGRRCGRGPDCGERDRQDPLACGIRPRIPGQGHAVRPPAYLRFSGGMPLGLFRGVRTYEVSEGAEGQVTFRMREGVQRPAAPADLAVDARPGAVLRAFARGLKQRVESGG